MSNFVWNIPCHFHKNDDKEGGWTIEGIASTKSRDAQNEVVDQDGLDISNLLKRKAYFNEDHRPGIEHKVGKITKAKKTDKGLYVKGYLFKNSPKAKAFRDIMTSLKKGDEKSVKLSIEGKILKRAPGNRIAQARVTGVALTLNPVNEDTYARFMKSLKDNGCDEKDDYGVLEHGDEAENIESAVVDYVVEESAVSSSAVDSSLLNDIDNKYVLVEKNKLAKTLKLAKLKYTENIQKGMKTGNYDVPPSDRSGQTAYSKESLDKKKKKIQKDIDERSKFTNLVKKLRKSYPNMDVNKIIELSCIIYEDKLFKKNSDKEKL